MISFLQQENMQLNVNQLLLRKPKVDLVAEKDKGKVVIYVEQLQDKEFQVQPRRKKTRGRTRQKRHESESSSPLGQQDFDDMIPTEIEQEK